MRLWHYLLIPHLPRQLLLDQHRTCCALRGKGWGRRHKSVNYVWNYPFSKLFGYHQLVIAAMRGRNYLPNPSWDNPEYRGRFTGPMPEGWEPKAGALWKPFEEHDQELLGGDVTLINKKVLLQRNGKDIYSPEDKTAWINSLHSISKYL